MSNVNNPRTSLTTEIKLATRAFTAPLHHERDALLDQGERLATKGEIKALHPAPRTGLAAALAAGCTKLIRVPGAAIEAMWAAEGRPDITVSHNTVTRAERALMLQVDGNTARIKKSAIAMFRAVKS